MSMEKTGVCIIGTGNIGSDLLQKVMRSPFLTCTLFTGRSSDSDGIARAKEMGITTSTNSIEALKSNPGCCQIVFDATSAKVHLEHAPLLKALGKFTVDLTPSRIGAMCVPAVNLEEALTHDNVNMVTCGGQASIPIAYALRKAHSDIEYIEVVSSIAARSAGIGTRANVDEYTRTTSKAIETFTGVKKAKSILILNPAEPPINMRTTIYAQIDKPDIEKITREVDGMVKKIQTYVPGYQIVVGPVAEEGRITVMIEVIGRGDFLPTYAGNLDVITSTAVQVAEAYAQKHSS